MSRFVTLPNGERRWGPFGAAGFLFCHTDAAGVRRFLLMLRAETTHLGGVWALPGGALDEGEDPLAGACRETVEELGGIPEFEVLQVFTDDEGGWAYTSVVASVTELWQPPEPNWEVAGTGWFTDAEARAAARHPRLALAWPALVAPTG